jgi:tetratricopeptide (TPR) repeat protein
MSVELEFRSRRSSVEAAQVAAWQQQSAAYQAERERQIALAAAAQGAREQARRDLQFATELQRQQLLRQQALAQQALIAQAQAAQAQNMLAQRAALLQTAAAIQRNEQVMAQLAQARAAAAIAQQQQMAAERAKVIDQIHRQQAAQVMAVQAQVAAAVQKQQAERQAVIKTIATNLQTEYDQFVSVGKQAQAKGNYPGAVSAFENAKRIKPSAEIDGLLSGALLAQARAEAALKGELQKQRFEAGYAKEQLRQQEITTAAAARQAQYVAAYKRAQQAYELKAYEEAAKAYREALAYQQTQEAQAALQKAEAELSRARLAGDIAAKQKEADGKKLATAAEKLADGRSAIARGDIAKALVDLRTAAALKPGDVEIQKSLADAEALQAKAATAARDQKEREDRLAALQRNLAVGEQNLKAKQYDAAIVAFTAAVRLDPKNPNANAGLQQAQALQKETLKDATALAAAKKKRDEYEIAMRKGGAAAGLRQYADALGFYQQAQTLLPGDAASAGMILEMKQKVQVASVPAKNDAATKKDPVVKKSAQVDQMLAKARAAIQAKDLDGAAKLLADATAADPTDPDVKAVRAEYDAARRQVAAADAEAKKNQTAYLQSLRDASNALAAKKYDVAVREAKEALAAKPGDPAATKILNDAQKAQDAAATAAADTEKKKDAYDAAIRAGRTAYAARKFDEAARAFEEALQAKPGDPTATQSLAIVKKAAAAAATAANDESKKKDAYDAAMTAGRAALAKKDYDAAIKSFTDALRADPGDPTATALLKQARDAHATPAPPTAPAVDPKRKELYDAWMAHAEKLMTARKFTDAVEAFQNALRAMPGDAAATKGLAEARAAATPAKVDPKPADPVPKVKDPVVPKKELPKPDPTAARVAELLKTAASLENGQQYAEAARTYQEVLKLAPANAEAKKGADFSRWMDQGSRQLVAGKLAEAAASFEQALKIDPQDENAKRLLQQARPPKKKK